MTQTLHLTDRVQVRLTAYGKARLRFQGKTIPAERDGWSTWDLWNLFRTFGAGVPHASVYDYRREGVPDADIMPPFEPTIRLCPDRVARRKLRDRGGRGLSHTTRTR